MARRGTTLELAVLGLLQETPMHGYELRKQLNVLLGWSRVLSYGTLYPSLKTLLAAGRIAAQEPPAGESPEKRAGRRGRIVYALTDDGAEHLGALLGTAGPASWDDETFGVRLAFFARTDSPTRLRILEGRRSRLEERLDDARTALARAAARPRTDPWALELQRHGVELVELEVGWLTRLVDAERTGAPLRADVPASP